MNTSFLSVKYLGVGFLGQVRLQQPGRCHLCFVLCRSFYVGQLNRWVVLRIGALTCVFLMTNKVRRFKLHFFAILVPSMVKCLFRSFAHIFIELFALIVDV